LPSLFIHLGKAGLEKDFAITSESSVTKLDDYIDRYLAKWKVRKDYTTVEAVIYCGKIIGAAVAGRGGAAHSSAGWPAEYAAIRSGTVNPCE
jgi:hypothetical protein